MDVLHLACAVTVENLKSIGGETVNQTWTGAEAVEPGQLPAAPGGGAMILF